MLVKNETGLINCLKDFQKEVFKIPRKMIGPAHGQIYHRLEYIFDHYVDVYAITDTDIDVFMKFLEINKIDNIIKNLITARLISKLEDIRTIESKIARRKIINGYVLKIIT